MIKFMNLECITEKEASVRYGYSEKWFQLMRRKKEGPPYLQIKKKGKVLYSINDVDNWFKVKLQENE